MHWIQGASPITFPGLGLEINPAVGFSIGNINVHFYGICIALGLLLAVLYAWKRTNEFGINDNDLTDGILWVVPLAIVCARLYYCVFRWHEDGYGENPISVLYVWQGGLAIYGGVIGAAVGVVVHCLIKKIKIPALLDMVALGFLIGQCLGRWGNFFNREAYGAETDFFLRMGLLLDANRQPIAQMQYYHPTFLYESIWNAVGFVMLHVLSKRRQYDGQIALGYVAWYGLGRAFIEGLRTDSLYLGPFRVSQLLAAASCFVAVVVLMIQHFRPHKPEDLFVNQVSMQEKPQPEPLQEQAEEPVEE